MINVCFLPYLNCSFFVGPLEEMSAAWYPLVDCCFCLHQDKDSPGRLLSAGARSYRGQSSHEPGGKEWNNICGAMFNSLWRSDTTWRHGSLSILVWVIEYCLTVPNPLPDSVVTDCQFDHQEEHSVKFELKYKFQWNTFENVLFAPQWFNIFTPGQISPNLSG